MNKWSYCWGQTKNIISYTLTEGGQFNFKVLTRVSLRSSFWKVWLMGHLFYWWSLRKIWQWRVIRSDGLSTFLSVYIKKNYLLSLLDLCQNLSIRYTFLLQRLCNGWGCNMQFNGEEIGYTTFKIEMLGNKLTVWNYLS